MTQLSNVKQNIHQYKDKSCNLKNKKTNSRPNRAVWTVFVNCAHWRGSTLAIYKTVQIIFPLNLQTITITLDVVKWKWGGPANKTTFFRQIKVSNKHRNIRTLYWIFSVWPNLLSQSLSCEAATSVMKCFQHQRSHLTSVCLNKLWNSLLNHPCDKILCL